VLFILSKVVLVALVSVIVVVSGYPIAGPSDAPDQNSPIGNYEEYIRNLEKEQRYSYNEIDEPLQPVLEDDDDVELSLLAQPVSQPPSADGFSGSTSRPIAPSKDSLAEDGKSIESVDDDRHDDESSESGKVEKDSSAEHAPAKDESAEDSKLFLMSDNKEQEESKQDPEHVEHEEESSPVVEVAPPVADADAGSELATGSDIVTESPQVQHDNIDAPSHVAQPEEEQVVVLDASGVSEDAAPVTDFPVASIPQDYAESDGSSAPSTDAPAQLDENPVVVLEEIAPAVSVSENEEGSGSLVADSVLVVEDEKEIVAHADGLEGSGLSVADAQPEVGTVASDDLTEEGSGFLIATAVHDDDEGSGHSTEELRLGALLEEGSGSADDVKVESPEELKVSEPVGQEQVVALDASEDSAPVTDFPVAFVPSKEDAPVTDFPVAFVSSKEDGSGDAGESTADEESTVGPAVENDEASGASPVASAPEMDHPELSDDSSVKEEAKLEEIADDAVKFIPVEVIVDTGSQMNTEEKVNEPETTESTLKVETGVHPSGDMAALPETLPEAAHTETTERDQSTVVEKVFVADTDLIADNAEITSEEPQGLMQSDEFIPAAAGSQRSSRLFL